MQTISGKQGETNRIVQTVHPQAIGSAQRGTASRIITSRLHFQKAP